MQVSERTSKVHTSNFPSLKQATNALTAGIPAGLTMPRLLLELGTYKLLVFCLPS